MSTRTVLWLVSIMLVLIGCNETNEDIRKERAVMEEKEEQAKEGWKISRPEKTLEDPTAEKILDEVQETNKNINSLQQKIESTINLKIEDQLLEEKIMVDQEMDMGDFHSKQHIIQDIDGEKTDIIIYVNDQGVYIHDLTEDDWVEVDNYLQEKQLKDTMRNLDLNENINSLYAFKEDFTLTENEEEYILSLKNVEEQHVKQLLTMVKSELSEILFETDDVDYTYTGDNIELSLTIEKGSFYILAYDAKLSFDIEMDEGPAVYEEVSQISYSKFDEIDEIIIPEEGIEKAK